MSGPTTYQIQPNKWIVPKPGGTHDPNCPNPDCPYNKSKPESKQLTELRLLIQANAEAISVLSLATSVPGPPGPSGPQGPPGGFGAPFKLSDATDEEVAAFALRLPPYTFQAYTPDDKPYGKPLVKHLGETVDILSLTGTFQSR